MSPPEGTRPWRKGWRKRWREGSSFRTLSMLQRLILIWIEENADDEGKTGPTTERYLAALMSSPREKVSRDAVHRAVAALIKSGLCSKHPHQEPHQEPHTDPHLAPTVYVRANWTEYQARPDDPHQQPHQEPHRLVDGTRTYLAEEGRGKQKRQNTDTFSNENVKAATPQAPVLAFIRSCCPSVVLDGAAARQIKNRLKAGDPPDLVAAIAVVGLSDFNLDNVLVALSARYRLRIVDSDAPHAVHLQELRARYAAHPVTVQLAAANHSRPVVSPGLGSGNGEGQAQTPLRLPAARAVVPAGEQPPDGSGRQAGTVQDDAGVDDGRQSRDAVKARLLDWTRNATRTAGPSHG